LPVAGWSVIERIACRAGPGRDDAGAIDPRREIAALEWDLGRGGRDGPPDMAVERVVLLGRVAARLGYRPDPGLIDRALRARAAVALGRDLQPPGFAWMEAEIALTLAGIAGRPPAAGVTEAGLLDLLIDTQDSAGPFPLTEAQRAALRLAHRHRLLLISGPAGSGKTTVLRALCATLEEIGRRPLILTLAGRAARRAREVTGQRSSRSRRSPWRASPGSRARGRSTPARSSSSTRPR